MPRALKVFRTAIGFHDAYVAAPSRKAALAAWGTDKDLFARGAAEEVSDPKLTSAPLARPGEVIRTSRGGEAENLAALKGSPRRGAKRRASDSAAPAKIAAPAPPAPPPPPRPSRSKLEEVERALTRLREKHAAARQRITERKAALDREEADLLARQRAQAEQLEAELSAREAEYDAAMRDWRES